MYIETTSRITSGDELNPLKDWRVRAGFAWHRNDLAPEDGSATQL